MNFFYVHIHILQQSPPYYYNVKHHYNRYADDQLMQFHYIAVNTPTAISC